MNYGPVATASVATIDSVAPGAPGIVSLSQVDNKTIKGVFALPSQDADGSPLTGLTKLVVCTAVAVDGMDPFAGLNAEGCLAVPGVQVYEIPVTPELTGPITQDIGIVSLGSVQMVAAFCSD